ncbi:MAG: hypothetical protein MHMPM18_002884 [Marteilia pararefringens]
MCIPSHKHSLLASKNSSDLNDLLEIDEMFGRNLWTNDNENENNNNNNNADNGDDEAPPQSIYFLAPEVKFVVKVKINRKLKRFCLKSDFRRNFKF